MKQAKSLLLLFFFLMSITSFSQDTSKSRSGPTPQRHTGLANPLPTLPQFPGGNDSLAAFIKKHTQYPKQAKKQDISGAVEVYFTVAIDGSIIKPKISKSLGYGCDEEAIRIVNLMPKWKPAMKGREPMELNSQVTIPFGKQE